MLYRVLAGASDIQVDTSQIEMRRVSPHLRVPSVLAVTVIIYLLCGRMFARVDRTLTPNRTGASVVRAVIGKINISEIFGQSEWWLSGTDRDKVMIFLRRMAYVETKDGQTIQIGNSIGGIWNVSAEVFSKTKSSPSNEYHDRYTTIRENIKNSSVLLNIDWNNIAYEDMSVPMYSGLAAALHFDELRFTNGNGLLPSRLIDLDDLWINHFGGGDRDVSWRDEVVELKNNDLERKAKV